MDEEIVRHPLLHLKIVERMCPSLWSRIDAHRSQKAASWPRYCFLPIAITRDWAGSLTLGPDSDGSDGDIRGLTDDSIVRVAALAAWRQGKGIYVFDETVLDELWQTPIEGDLPSEVLEGLPEWCPYIAFRRPRRTAIGDICGFFVFLDAGLVSAADPHANYMFTPPRGEELVLLAGVRRTHGALAPVRTLD
jgi:hypothetical protein